MAVSRRAMVSNAVKLGVKYGPAAYEAVKHGREPAQVAARTAYGRFSARRQALAHAGTLVDGSAAKAYAGGEPVWVVFSGEEPIRTYPPTDLSMESVLAHADLGKRIRPEEVGRLGRRRRIASAPEDTRLPDDPEDPEDPANPADPRDPEDLQVDQAVEPATPVTQTEDD